MSLACLGGNVWAHSEAEAAFESPGTTKSTLHSVLLQTGTVPSSVHEFPQVVLTPAPGTASSKRAACHGLSSHYGRWSAGLYQRKSQQLRLLCRGHPALGSVGPSEVLSRTGTS